MKFMLPLALATLLSGCITLPGSTPPQRAAVEPGTTLPRMAQFRNLRPDPPMRANADMVQDFLDLAFRMESGRQLTMLSRFEGPITVSVTPGAPPTLIPDLDRLIGRLRTEARIDITRIDGPAQITVETLPRARMQRIVPQAACFVVPRVSSWMEFRRARGTSLLDWSTLVERDRVAVFIPSDVPPQEIRDCLHEEIGQAIGPLNDLYRLPDSVFNDDNFHAVLTGFDMLILRAYYDPALRAGMGRSDVAAALPGIFDRLNPRGRRGGAGPVQQTPRAWVDLVETALGRGTQPARRVSSAQAALAYAQSRGWSDARLGFSYFALGRLSLGRPGSGALASFRSAGEVYRRLDPNGIHVAHVNMQLAAFALSSGDLDAALTLTTGAVPAAMREENAALLATLLMIRAEALDRVGRIEEARTVRMDSLAWGRYGFGDTAALAARMAEIAALAP